VASIRKGGYNLERAKLFIFDSYDNLLAVTKDYIQGMFKENVEKPKSFKLYFPASNENATHLVGGNQVAFFDLRGNLRLFTIREVDDQDGQTIQKVVTCLPAMQELTETMIEERTPQNKTAEYTLDLILQKTRFKPGNVADLGYNSTNFYFKNAFQCLGNITQVWGGEAIDRIEIENGKIAGRYIDLLARKGADTGKRWEMDKDIQKIRRTKLFYPKTAMYGKGSSVQTEGGGHSRKITFRDVEWQLAYNDPASKPPGQEWVGDSEALEQYGIPNHETGELMHRMGYHEETETEDPETLLNQTWNALQFAKEPQAEYEMSIITFYGVAGYEHENVYLGDTGIARDMGIQPAILIEARITEMEYDIGDPRKGTVKVGNIIELNQREREIDWVIDEVKDNKGRWNSGGNPTDDISFPDIKPATPENVQAEGLFKTIMVSWTYNPSVLVNSYEIYASQVKGFAPDSTNLIFRGDVGVHNHKVDTDQTWYYRVRAVNTHGTPSDYSEEVTASTVQLNLGDVEEIVPEFIEYGIYKGDEAPDPNEYHYWIDIDGNPQLLYAYNEENQTWIPLAPTNAGEVGAVDTQTFEQNISDLQITDNQIQSSVENLRGTVNRQGTSIENQASAIQQNANSITSKVEQSQYSFDMENMRIRVSEAESSITQNADEITSKVSQNGVVSSINQSPEQIKIDAARVSLGDGDLVVQNGNVYIQNGTITDNLIAQNAQIDGAKIASISAGKVESGTLEGVQIRTSHENRYLFMQNQVLDFNDNNTVKMTMGFRDQNGNDTNEPYIIMGAGNSLGQDQFTIEKQQSYVLMEYTTQNDDISSIGMNYSGDAHVQAANRLYLAGDEVINNSALFTSDKASINTVTASNHDIVLTPSSGGYARIRSRSSTTDYRPLIASNVSLNSSEKQKTNIQEWNENEALDKIKNDMTLYKYNRKDDVENGRNKQEYGLVIGKDRKTPPEFLDGVEAIDMYNFMSWNAKAIQELCVIFEKQQKEINELKGIET